MVKDQLKQVIRSLETEMNERHNLNEKYRTQIDENKRLKEDLTKQQESYSTLWNRNKQMEQQMAEIGMYIAKTQTHLFPQ